MERFMTVWVWHGIPNVAPYICPKLMERHLECRANSPSMDHAMDYPTLPSIDGSPPKPNPPPIGRYFWCQKWISNPFYQNPPLIGNALRTGLLLAPGGEFAFVAFGEAVNQFLCHHIGSLIVNHLQDIMSHELSSLLILVVGISMAITPWLAAGGQLIASRFEQQDVRSLLPAENETDDLQGHIIICGFGRVGQIVAQLLSERLIPFVALDARSDRVAIGRAMDLRVRFGDSGSQEILHKIGAERACAAAITLDTPDANYRAVWALSKYFPNVKTFLCAHDVEHGLNLEKAGASAVVSETLEPSLQLAAAVLAQLCEISRSSLGYGFSRVMAKLKPSSSMSCPNLEGTLREHLLHAADLDCSLI